MPFLILIRFTGQPFRETVCRPEMWSFRSKGAQVTRHVVVTSSESSEAAPRGTFSASIFLQALRLRRSERFLASLRAKREKKEF
jgi:hypothetical protein